MSVMLCVAVGFTLLLVLPLVIAYFFYKTKAGTILFINQNKTHDPRYLGKAFAEMMDAQKDEIAAGEVHLSRNEPVSLIDAGGFAGPTCENVVVCTDPALTIVPEGMTLFKELYAEGDLCVAGKTALRSVYAKKSLILGNHTSVVRWADAVGAVTVYDHCELGISTTSATALMVGGGCTFRRLYAPVVTLGLHPGQAFPPRPALPAFVLGLTPEKQKQRNVRYITDSMIDENGVVPFTVVTNQDLVVTEALLIKGDIRSEKGVKLCENTIVCGNVFAEQTVALGRNCTVLGTIFTQGSVVLEDGVVVGAPDHKISIIARDSIRVNGAVRVYGYLCCEKGGFVAVRDGAECCAPEDYRFWGAADRGGQGECLAALNDRLHSAPAQKFYAFSALSHRPAGSAAPADAPAPTKKDSAALRGIQLTAAVAAACVVCLAATAVGAWLQQAEEAPVILQAELYPNQGLPAGTTLAAQPNLILPNYLIYDDRILQRYTATDEDVALNAVAVDSLLDLVPDGVNKYAMLVPLRIYYEPDAAQYAGDMPAAAAEFAAQLPDVQSIELFDALPHSEDYLFFRTEMYWTAEGAYYGAKAFLAATGQQLAPLGSYAKHTYETFGGSLHADAGMSENVEDQYDDRVFFYTSAAFTNQEILYTRDSEGNYSASHQPVLSKMRTGTSSFVGNNTFSHAIIKGSVQNGKTLLLIGDRSAFIMASYFTDYYETVYVVNQTWYHQQTGSFAQIFEDYPVSECLYTESIGQLGNELTRQRIASIARDYHALTEEQGAFTE